MKKKTVVLSAAVLLTAILLSGVTYAWFRYGDDIPGMGLKLVKVDSTVTLYRGVDGNYNGIPEFLYAAPSGEGYADRTWVKSESDSRYYEKCGYYNEFYNFSKLGMDYATNEERDITLHFNITDALPGRIYTYKFALENKSDAENVISCGFDSNAGATGLLSFLAVRVGRVDRATQKVEWISFGDEKAEWVRFGDAQASELLKDNVAGLVASVTQDGANCYDFWLQIKMMPLEATATPEQQAQYNQFQGKNADLPVFRINFNIEGE